MGIAFSQHINTNSGGIIMSDWIKWNWTPEKPYPETLETNVFVRFRCGLESKYSKKVEVLLKNFESYSDVNDITHYKVIK